MNEGPERISRKDAKPQRAEKERVLHEYRSRNWQKVRLRTQPVDPVSLFRGRYVRLGYAFDALQTRDGSWQSGEEVCIRLIPQEDGIWGVEEFGRSLDPRPGSALLRGEVAYVSRPSAGLQRLSVTPLGSYFLSEP